MGRTNRGETAQSRLESVMLEDSVAWWEIDLETGWVAAHRNRARMLGYEPERFTHHEDFLELLHPEDRDRVVGEMWAHLDGERERYDVEYRMRTADGGYRWLHDVGSITDRDADDDPSRIAGLVIDITERKLREQKLDTLREYGQALMHTATPVETAEVAAQAADDVIGAPLSGVHLVTEAGDAMEPAAVVDSVHDFFEEPPTYPRDADPGTRATLVWEAYESGEPLLLEETDAADRLEEETPAGCVLLHPVGDHGVFVVSAPEPRAFDETDRTMAQLIATSLTTALDRVEREQRLRRRERNLERLHEAARTLVEAETRAEVAEHVVEAAEDILEFPIVLVRFFDADAGGLVPIARSGSVDELLPERSVFGPEGGSINWEAYETGELQVHDDIHPDHRAVDAETVIRSLFVIPLGDHGTLSAGDTAPDAFDETDLFLARILATAAETALDAAERETALRRQRNELERQNEQLEQFASIASHDLRNPLRVVSGSLELARETGEDEHFDRAARAVRRMETLIDDLLSLARAGDAISDPEPVDLSTLVQRCRESVDAGALSVSVEGDATVVADESRLAQLLENLLRNAAEHAASSPPSGDATGEEPAERVDGTGPAGGGVTVTVSPLADGFAVADDGPGIPEADREQVFESGYTTTPGGTGFGLAIVREIAEAHGWTVTVTESESGGARFEFTGVETLPD
jgi:PAS domain S-box-containing protein